MLNGYINALVLALLEQELRNDSEYGILCWPYRKLFDI